MSTYDARQAVAHWLDRNYGPSLHPTRYDLHDWLAAADAVLEVARANATQGDVSAEADTTSEVARVLIDHTRLTDDGKCYCGFQGRLGESFTAHQAEALAEAGLLRKEVDRGVRDAIR